MTVYRERLRRKAPNSSYTQTENSPRLRQARAAPIVNAAYPSSVSSPSPGPAPQYMLPRRNPTHIGRTPQKAEKLLVFVNGSEPHDFKFFLPSRGRHLHFVSYLAVQQSLANGRSRRDEPPLDVSFFGRDQLVFNFHFFVNIEDNNARPVSRPVLRNIAQVQHPKVAHPLLELPNACVHIALAFLCVLVLRVFRKVAVRTRFGDLFGEIDVELVLEVVDFPLQTLFDLRERVRHVRRSPKVCCQKNVRGVRFSRMARRTPRE